MSLGNQQREFTKNVGLLITYAYSIGYELTLGDASRLDRKGHSINSFHYQRLAIDLNLFKDGRYLTDTEDHAELGEYWIALGGTWGGNFKRKDGNHYSHGENG